MSEDVEIRPATPADDEALLALFARAGVPTSADELAWRRANPAGLRAWIALRGPRVVAHYATRPGRVTSDGAERVYAETVDAACDPGDPGGAEVLTATAKALLAETTGPEADLVTYGWLGEAEWMLSKDALKFEVMRMQSVLELSPAAAEAAPHGLEVAPLVPDEEVDALYRRCREAWESSSLRDAAYLRWRFLARPPLHGGEERVDYRLIAAREPGGGALRGYAVVRAVDSPAPGTLLVVDWLVADDDEEAGAALRGAVLDLGRAAGAPHVAASFPEWSPWFARFQEAGFLVRGTGLRLATRKVHPRHETYWLRDAWWYQPAEFETI